MTALSALATFDDIRRCMQVLTDSSAEEEFLRVLRLQEKFRLECGAHAQEAQRIQKELDSSLQLMADLETKLFHARRLLEMETKARREAEHERDQMEKKIVAVADLLQNERNLKDETKDKLAFLNTLPRKRKSLNTHREEKGNEINSTGSFLSDLSITQSDDDFLDMRRSKSWREHRPSVPKNVVPCVGSKRSRLSNGGGATPTTASSGARRSVTRRSGGVGVEHHTLQLTPGVERFCATTKVTIPQDGNGIIRAESTIESLPVAVGKQLNAEIHTAESGSTSTPKRSPFKDASAPPMTPASALPSDIATPKYTNLMGTCDGPSPAQLRPLMRKHNFNSKTFIRAELCAHCQKKIRFGAVGLRCRDCSIRCHVNCKYTLTISCIPRSNTPTSTKGFMGYAADYAPSVPPYVPALIVHCVNEIESRGFNEIGIYRVSGSEREVKSLKERFLRGKGTPPHLANIDVHVLCGCIKDFLRSLREPLIPTGLWMDFCNAVQNPAEQDIQKFLYKAIDALPQTNRDTLAFLILHFQRVANCPSILMPIDNLARVFGPTIVGYSSSDPDQHAIFTEVFTQCQVMLNLLKLPLSYWSQFINVVEDVQATPTSAQITRTPSTYKDSLYSLYATPLKSTLKKRKFYATPPPNK